MGGAEGAHPSLGAEFNRAIHQGAHHAGFGRGHTTGVKGPHCQLGAGFTDRLGGHDADGFAQIHQLVVG